MGARGEGKLPEGVDRLHGNKPSTVVSDELNRLLQCGEVVLPEIHVVDGGLDAIPGALDMLKNGTMKGKKLVVRVAE